MFDIETEEQVRGVHTFCHECTITMFALVYSNDLNIMRMMCWRLYELALSVNMLRALLQFSNRTVPTLPRSPPQPQGRHVNACNMCHES